MSNRKSGTTTIIAVFLFFFILAAIAGLIIAVLALVGTGGLTRERYRGRKSSLQDESTISDVDTPPSGGGSSVNTHQGDWYNPWWGPVYTIALERNVKPTAFIHPDTGLPTGGHSDTIRAACRAAQINCALVVRPGSDCWVTEGGFAHGGHALLSGQFHACNNWFPTASRANEFIFTESYSVARHSRFYVKLGTAASFDNANLTNKRIGFRNTYYSDAGCLDRHRHEIHGGHLEEDQTFVGYWDDLYGMVENGSLDAVFLTEFQSYRKYMDMVEHPIDCTLGGAAVMMRPHQTRLRDLLNVGLQRLRESGEGTRICEASNREWGEIYGYTSCEAFSTNWNPYHRDEDEDEEEEDTH